MKSDTLSACGVNCGTDCRAYAVECEGCNALLGMVSWAHFYGEDTCPIYACVMAKSLESCAFCGKAPCEIWNATRNPEASDEEFAADIANRMKNLNILRNKTDGN